MASPDPLFVQRPWPQRVPEDSPLRGRRVLVVAEDREEARRLGAALSRAGCSAQSASPGEPIERLVSGTEWEIAIVDRAALQLPEVRAWRAQPSAPEMLLFAAPTNDEGETSGADLCTDRVLPGASPEDLLVVVGRALERRALEAENRRLRDTLAERFTLGSVVTRDPAMRDILRTSQAIADTRATVLILGESGTGKSLLAQAIHQSSSRSREPFVVVNCGSLPDTLLESELFGHVRGAFTGAVKDKPGRFEQADGGTIFLDEINSASLDLQVKLLRVLQDRTFERVGDDRTRRVDVRVITASNRDLEVEIAAGRFREDLYYRIHVVSLELPSLRDRPGDVLLLAEHFLARYAGEYGKPVRRLAPACVAALVGFGWPGNVRQLENSIERAVLLSSSDELLVTDLSQELQGAARERDATPERGTLNLGLENLESLPSLKKALEGPEREIIQRALEINGGNRKQTAEMLDVNRTTLFNKMKKYGLMDLTFGAQ